MMTKYLDIDVLSATKERLKMIFDEFDHVCVSFSGGKDSGLLLNLCYDYARDSNNLNKMSMYHLDYEAQYQMTTDYVTSSFDQFEGIEKYWLCLPASAGCAVNMTNKGTWIPWDDEQREIWVRPLPASPYLIDESNCPFNFTKGQRDYKVQTDFSVWLSATKGKTAMLVGIRSDESLNRFRSVGKERVGNYGTIKWSTKIDDDCYSFYPVYDWDVKDVWIAHARFRYEYNKLYDIMWQGGLTLHQMRVASPFNHWATESLKLYRVIEPKTWGKLLGRVNGINFTGIYGGTTAMGWRSIKLPKDHTWKSYYEFLLTTLNKDLADNYRNKLEVSIKSWQKGGLRSDDVINDLDKEGVEYRIVKEAGDKKIIAIDDYMDDIDSSHFALLPSYKRMCICILKNDYFCRYMGFAQNKDEIKKRKRALEKYAGI